MQTAAADDEGEIIVTGIRESLRNAQNIKRDADTVVDAITAQDIGALPDRSVTEALQRVPGVSINRFAGSNDPDHFSVEGSGVVIRGLSFVRSEFNGRDTFSTGVYGQAINFADVPSELLGSVEVYKNLDRRDDRGRPLGHRQSQHAPAVRRSRLPFGLQPRAQLRRLLRRDLAGRHILVSNTWDTGIGRIGVLANFSYSQPLSRADAVHVTNFQTRDGATVVQSNTAKHQVCRKPSAGRTPIRQTLPRGGLQPRPQERPAPHGLRRSRRPCAMRRSAASSAPRITTASAWAWRFAAQWESLDDRSPLLTLQYLRTKSTFGLGRAFVRGRAGPVRISRPIRPAAGRMAIRRRDVRGRSARSLSFFFFFFFFFFF